MKERETSRIRSAPLANGSNSRGLSLSPLSLLALGTPGPGGAAVAQRRHLRVLAARAGSTVIAGCLRNADAVGRAFL